MSSSHITGVTGPVFATLAAGAGGGSWGLRLQRLLEPPHLQFGCYTPPGMIDLYIRLWEIATVKFGNSTANGPCSRGQNPLFDVPRRYTIETIESSLGEAWPHVWPPSIFGGMFFFSTRKLTKYVRKRKKMGFHDDIYNIISSYI